MNRHILSTCQLTALLCAAAPAHADPQKIACPAELAPAAVRVTAQPAWRTYVPHALPLFGAGMSAGPPESEMQLRGEPEDRKGAVTSYSFGTVGMEQGRWLDCHYGRAGEVMMSLRLDDAVRRCTITHHKLVTGEPRRIDIACK